jgi:hypothetical protein
MMAAVWETNSTDQSRPLRDHQVQALAFLPRHDAEAVVFDREEPAGADWRLQR